MSAGRTQTPTLINLPPPPADPMTPSDAPGTPNSGTTSMSELSTVAIKDGHRGHLPHHNAQNPMDAERADRISRLAGLDRMAHNPSPRNLGSNAGSTTTQQGQHPLAHAYFDSNNVPQITRERSTVGSASATGSVGARTTWASESDAYDKFSEDMDVDNSSVGGFSDEASLVGFGEGARTPARPASAISPLAQQQQPPPPQSGGPAVGTKTPTSGSTPQSLIEAQKQDARMIDGFTNDPDVVDTSVRTPQPVDD